ncbi:MAG: ABC transporter permease, partial [Saprospiraceae bacterium]|nr:ABC transporter permease [Saprospiraceae bacterium]
MLTNFLKVAFRNLWRNKIQSLILIGGLTAGMTTCILLLQYISFELSFDQFHSQKDRIFRVVNERFQQGKSVQKGTITYPTIGPTLKEEYPEVKAYTRLAYSNDLLMNFGDKIEPVSPGIYADQYFFSVFDFDLLASEANVILEEPNQIVLTKSLADRYF